MGVAVVRRLPLHLHVPPTTWHVLLLPRRVLQRQALEVAEGADSIAMADLCTLK